MKAISAPESAEEDKNARNALWKAICVASDDVRHGFRIGKVLGINGAAISVTSDTPAVKTWRLVEALSLLGVILRSEDAVANEINIFGKTGPIEIKEDRIVSYLWAQQTLQGEISQLSGRPDLIVTSSAEPPSPNNATRIIEAKCEKQLGTHEIRSEFGKAHDLRVATYIIWSFYSPTQKVIDGAKRLGIDLERLGFDTEEREDLVRDPRALIGKVAYPQEQARHNQRFAKALAEASKEYEQKLRLLGKNTA